MRPLSQAGAFADTENNGKEDESDEEQDVLELEKSDGRRTFRRERVLELYGTIAEESWFDDDITPAMFKEELFAGSGPITIWINSPGGDCIAVSQIYTMLMDCKGDATVKVDGIAASAASAVAMAGTKVLMAPTALMMIHNPAMMAFGDFKNYWIGDRAGRTIQRLNELYATNGQIGYAATERVDGKVIQPEGIQLLKMKAGNS